MNRLTLFFSIILLVTAITWVAKAQTKPKELLKTYSVSLTLEQWQNVLNGLEVVKNSVKTSTMPSNQTTYIVDSLINPYQNEFGRQIQGQLAAEQKAKTEVKKDSTSKKK